VDREPSLLASFLHGVDLRWHEQAACRGVDFDFVLDESSVGRVHLASAAELTRLLICDGCPVREPCLRDAFSLHPLSHIGGERERPVETWGVWGGSFRTDRHGVRDLPLEEAIEALEASLPSRLDARIEAWSRAVAERAPRRLDRWDHRVLALLAERSRVKRFHLRNPGPGRGHRGPIATLAAELGCSRSTAWRRLRAL
jgi:hypothetical protein